MEAIDEMDIVMDAFSFVETAIQTEFELPFGMPRGISAQKLGTARCKDHQNKHTRKQYSGYKEFELVPPW